MTLEPEAYKPANAIRMVTATSLFDGHDAAINIVRRMLQSTGVEVIHLGHNRSVEEIVSAAVEEGAHALAVSSYQGGHMEFFKYLVDLLAERGAPEVKVFGGGGGVIIPEEIEQLQRHGVCRIYSPEDGTTLGLQGIINDMVRRTDEGIRPPECPKPATIHPEDKLSVSRAISAVEWDLGGPMAVFASDVVDRKEGKTVPVLGVTGTGGAGKSSLVDELVSRLLRDQKDLHLAVVSTDPSRRKTGGALLGDRIRMNAISGPRVFMRSLATRRSMQEIPECLPTVVNLLRKVGFDLVILETAGIGQGDSSIVDFSDVSMYVMTSEFGAASQLEKIDMLDYADIVVVNKFEKRGSEDAFRDVRKQVQRNRKRFEVSPDEMPVFGTIASRFNDDGVTALYHGLRDLLKTKCGFHVESSIPRPADRKSSSKTILVPPERVRYLSDVSASVRTYHGQTRAQKEAVERHWHLSQALSELSDMESSEMLAELRRRVSAAEQTVSDDTRSLLKEWQEVHGCYQGDELVYSVRGKEFRVPLTSKSLSHSRIPKVALPRFDSPGDLYRFMREENVPGRFPFTAGVFPLKRTDEDPTRMFAGEGDPARTNRRFKLLSGNYEAKRLSTAFDSATLYGCDPDPRPDIYGKIGTSGVSVCTLEDVKTLYSGFDLCSPNNSVSMTINGPAPIVLAMFMNTAIDQQVDRFAETNGRQPAPEEREQIAAEALRQVRGTVQADILKEDQGQNTCIFSTDFALRMMGDIQQYFIDHQVRNFYSVSISGYHIAEAGANPISQLAFTLANGFTYVEYYLSRGMPLDSFAPNLSFFFSNGMDPEYSVIGRVARRIWSIAMKYLYKGSVRSQMLKYHIQTSGRSLHSQEIQFNDIRTTLQALCGIYDNCNSLHTNAYDEAVTTPTTESVRRALAIQLIVNREWGLAKNENSLQGSFIVEELTQLVEEAVLSEFDRITERGGVLGAMETGYQRSRIQEESMYYEMLKHTGAFPIIGVNSFLSEGTSVETLNNMELARATEEEKQSQLQRLSAFKGRNRAHRDDALQKLQQAALSNENVFAELMSTVRCCSLGDIVKALYEVGGRYRRNM